MPLVLDRKRPYAEIHGLPGASFEQDGVKFKTDGTVADDITPIVDEIRVSEPELNPPSSPCIEQHSPHVDTTNGDSLEDLHWKKLKVLVESFGGVWTNRADAIKFLKKGE